MPSTATSWTCLTSAELVCDSGRPVTGSLIPMEVKAAIERRLREEEALRRIEGERERLKSIREKAEREWQAALLPELLQ